MTRIVLTPADRDVILRAATSAPSKHNTQPWRFSIRRDTLEIRVDTDRLLPVEDPDLREVHLACGAAVLGARVGFAHVGLDAHVALVPDPADPMLVARLTAVPGNADPMLADLYGALSERHTNRYPFEDTELPEAVRADLRDAAVAEGAVLRFVDVVPEYERLLTLIREATALEDEAMRAERAEWVVTGPGVDGIPATALGPLPGEYTGALRNLAEGREVAGRKIAEFEELPEIAVLETRGDTPRDWLTAGQALQRVLLVATVRSVSASFANQPLEDPDMRPEVSATAAHHGRAQMILRLGYGTAVEGTPRRAIKDVVEVYPDADAGGAPGTPGTGGDAETGHVVDAGLYPGVVGAGARGRARG